MLQVHSCQSQVQSAELRPGVCVFGVTMAQPWSLHLCSYEAVVLLDLFWFRAVWIALSSFFSGMAVVYPMYNFIVCLVNTEQVILICSE